MKVTAAQGDTVDSLCWQHLGAAQGEYVAVVYALNPGLAELGAILPMGTVVVLPDVKSARRATKPLIQLWS